MDTVEVARYFAFAGQNRVGTGELAAIAAAAKVAHDSDKHAQVLIFDERSELVDVDLSGTVADVVSRIAKPTPIGPGRPKLGVVAREVTLLPRHWDWLNSQPGGASVTLRKLVEAARRSSESADSLRTARDITYKFMHAMAGNLPGFEEATRALFAGNQQSFETQLQEWPKDIREHTNMLSQSAWAKDT